MQQILVAGGAGFIGSNFVKHLLAGRGYRVRVLDKLTYAGNLDNFPAAFWKDPRFEFVRGDVCRRPVVLRALRDVDAVVNFVAETHIDRSIDSADAFVRTDFEGTHVLLDEFRRHPHDRFIQISTCEVYGSARTVPMDEAHPLEPQSPYAATKAGADRLCYSYFRTYGLPVTILRPFNVYGPNQYPEKVIPFFVASALENRSLYVYGSGRNTRDWTYVSDLCRAVESVLTAPVKRVVGEVFNIGSGEERSSLQIAQAVVKHLGKSPDLIRHIQDRPGHVERLVCDTRKASRVLGWSAETKFEPGLAATVEWYLANRQWWQEITRRTAYRDFYRRWYTETLGAAKDKGQSPKDKARSPKSKVQSPESQVKV
jgi:dTDP-glucose 4,6-dehydratase